MRRILASLLLSLLVLPGGPAGAGRLVDATGRSVTVPDHPARVLPAGPPAAVLLAALAPDLMLGWPHVPRPGADLFLPEQVSALPEVPHLTGKTDVTAQVAALHPDLIVDYGNVTPHYTELAAAIQQKTGVPTILLDGRLARTPQALRMLGTALGRPERAELLARLAESILAAAPPVAGTRTVVYAKGADGLSLAEPGTLAAEVFDALGWKLVAPDPTKGEAFHTATIAEIARLDPDLLILAEPDAATAIAGAPAWQTVRAVRDHRAFTAPRLPFGWVEEPPSINRLLGVAWLSSGDAGTVAAMFNAVVFGRAPNADQIGALRDADRPVAP